MDKEKKEPKPRQAKDPVLDAPAVAEAPKTVRLRMMRSASTALGFLRAGMTVNVPSEMARDWMRAGLAEQDKSLDGPPETK